MAKIFGTFKSGVRAAFDPMGRGLVRMGVSPDAVTLLGTAGVVAASVGLAARGHLVVDGALFGALVWWQATTGQAGIAVVTLVCLVGGQVVSYVKARAEGLGFTADVGIAERMERLILIGIGGLSTAFGTRWILDGVIWLLAVLTVVTVAQRLLHVRAQEIRQRSQRPTAGAML
jgi:CDP-diacylglycerol--glycerol-3-phosphate 3-phosphatidyltransferase